MLARAVHARNPLRLPQDPTYYRLARSEVAQFLAAHGVRAHRVLELGCATGEMGKQIKEQLGASYYAGIDNCEAAVNEARGRLDHVYLADIERTSPSDLGLVEGEFDCLVALDVLEHLRDPWDVLAALTRLLKPSGRAVFSIPNVQNLGILHGLAQGKWTYESSGLLDATHLRFFTLESIHELIAGAGLVATHLNIVLNQGADAASLHETGNTIRAGNLTVSNLSREEALRFFAWQYLLIAERRAPAPGAQ
jgi:2-polyprenyl-3-methyl-5-hydroxy-6-metoxy-1,4-benzoquinol methylase